MSCFSEFPQVLQYVDLRVQSDYRCSVQWARYGEFNPEYQICAKRGYHGPCGVSSLETLKKLLIIYI